MEYSKQTNRLRLLARLLIIAWALFWTYFLGANLMGNANTTPTGEQTKGYVVIIGGLLLIWTLGYLAWRKERFGASLLVGFGAVLMIGYIFVHPQLMQFGNVLSTAAMLGASPLLAGILLWIAQKR